MSNCVPSADTVPISLPTARSNYFDPPLELARLREEQSLRRLEYVDGHQGWLVTSYALARAVLCDARFSSRPELLRPPVGTLRASSTVRRAADPGDFVRIDPPEHTRFRRMLAGEFTVRKMNELRPQIESIVEGRLDAMEQAPRPVDLVQMFAVPVPMLTICELLGVPYSSRKRFERETQVMVSVASTSDEVAASVQAVTDFLYELVRDKRARPSEDLLGRLVVMGQLSDTELVGIARALLLGGHETTANMLAFGTFALLLHPAQLKALKADYSLIDNTVEELLRYLTIVQFGRTRAALEDIELEGRVIKEGECVTVSLPAANRDPHKFAEPDEFNIIQASGGHLSFGHGIHQCIGQHLARLEMRIGLSALFKWFPQLRMAVAPEDIPLRRQMITYGVHELPVTW